MARVKYGPVSMEWVENPFEWIEGRRMCVLREFQSGPFKTFVNIVELKRRADGGTRLSHVVKFLPRNAAGRLLARFEVRWRTRKSLDRVYRRIDESLLDEQAAARNIDPFEPTAKLSSARRSRLADRIDQLVKRGVARELAERLGEFVAAASPQEVARIRPVELADRLQREQDEVLVACLHAVSAGILKLQWDILCPTCRIASDTQATLREIAKHSFCEACNLDFETRSGQLGRADFPRPSRPARRGDRHLLRRRSRTFPARRGATPPGGRRANGGRSWRCRWASTFCAARNWRRRFPSASSRPGRRATAKCFSAPGRIEDDTGRVAPAARLLRSKTTWPNRCCCVWNGPFRGTTSLPPRRPRRPPCFASCFPKKRWVADA